MPRLAIDKDFLDDYSKLEKSVRTAVKVAIDKFAEHTYAGLHLEKLQKSVDDRIRTIRIDQFWRGVVLAPDSGDTYYLMKVMPHDKAIDYAASHRLTVNQALGVVEVRNETAIEQIHPGLEKTAKTTDERLFANVSDADLSRLGVDDNTRTIARLLTSEAHLDAMQNMIPEAQYNALYLLAGGLSVEEVWAEVAQYAPQRTRRHRQRRQGHGAHVRPRGLRRQQRRARADPWSTRSLPGGSSCIRRSGRSLTRPVTQARRR